jgi:hypothetical protein
MGEKETVRMEAFSDSVFAVAITPGCRTNPCEKLRCTTYWVSRLCVGNWFGFCEREHLAWNL